MGRELEIDSQPTASASLKFEGSVPHWTSSSRETASIGTQSDTAQGTLAEAVPDAQSDSTSNMSATADLLHNELKETLIHASWSLYCKVCCSGTLGFLGPGVVH